MTKEIFMPKLSSTMEVGTLLQWFKEEGEQVEIGDPLFEIMTDKINIEVDAYDSGVLLKKYYQTDDEVPVNQVIGYIGKEEDKVPDQSPGISGSEKDTKKEQTQEEPIETSQVAESSPGDDIGVKKRATPAARKLVRDGNLELSSIEGSGPNKRIQKKDVIAYIEHNKESSVRSTPLARKAAIVENVSISNVEGSGSGGKILKKDVLSAINQVEDTANRPKRKKIAGIRKVIADKMTQSAFTAPHVTFTTEIEMTKLKELRNSLLPVIEKQTGLRLSYTDILIKATGEALARHPKINVSIEGNELIEHTHISIGIAVAVPDGLIVPVIKDVTSKGIAELTKDAKDIINRTRANQVRPDEMKGSTFTISNLGMYAIDGFTPIINQPESAILGVGRIQDKPVAIDGVLEIRPMMTLSLSVDHRTIDGAPAAAFLTELKEIIENPYQLLI